MFLTLATATALSLGTQPSCSWNRPGADAYQGEISAAIERYRDIPPAVRAALRERAARHAYDDLAVIRRDDIVGRYRYGELRDMHFGKGRICRTVTRTGWPTQAEERGLVYCEQSHCIIVPTVCRNVSRVTRLGPVQEERADAGELPFEPPSAGLPPDASFQDRSADPSVSAAATRGAAGPMSSTAPMAALAPGSSGDGSPGGPGSVTDPAAPGSFSGPDGPRVPLLPIPPGWLLPPWVPEPGPEPGPGPGPEPGPGPGPEPGPEPEPGPGPEPPPNPGPGPDPGPVPGPGPIPGPGPLPPIGPPVTPIPEPGTWALTLAGLGLVALVAKRRQRAARMHRRAAGTEFSGGSR